jgi:NAD(P)-dependent dehydrogenase (short-subunit alcohol dehydrogenase family)
MLIGTGTLAAGSLTGETVVVTGGGNGIGFEAARSLLWLGAAVVIAEIDETAAASAERRLADEWSPERICVVTADVADEASVRNLVGLAEARFGRIDVVLNNATYAPAGEAVVETAVGDWDRSYAVNLRGPVLLARACLPAMVARRHGTFVCVSSTGGPFLAAYETQKAAQVALANSLDAELEGSGVTAFTIGPGLVPTATAKAAIERVAPRLGMSLTEFWTLNQGAVLSVEAAGAGFAAAIALASRYAGQEISSSQALIDAGIDSSGGSLVEPQVDSARVSAPSARPEDLERAAASCRTVAATLREQAAGWAGRSFFERQWMLRDFKQRAGMPVERMVEGLDRMTERLADGDLPGALAASPPLERLAGFYEHLGDLARGYVKDPHEREKQMATVAGWQNEVTQLIEGLSVVHQAVPA